MKLRWYVLQESNKANIEEKLYDTTGTAHDKNYHRKNKSLRNRKVKCNAKSITPYFPGKKTRANKKRKLKDEQSNKELRKNRLKAMYLNTTKKKTLMVCLILPKIKNCLRQFIWLIWNFSKSTSEDTSSSIMDSNVTTATGLRLQSTQLPFFDCYIRDYPLFTSEVVKQVLKELEPSDYVKYAITPCLRGTTFDLDFF